MNRPFVFLIIVLAAILSLSIVTGFVGYRPLFYILEALCVAALVLLFSFHRHTVKPLRTLAGGMELLKEQDFSSRLCTVGQADVDRVVEVFNRMMKQLKDERLRLREQNHFLDLLIGVSPMGVVVLDFNDRISTLNPAAKHFLECGDEVAGQQMDALDSVLAHRLAGMRKESTDTFQLTDSHVFRCSRLSFTDRGFAHPFFLIESLTDEVVNAEKKAYEKVIRMIAHEVNNSVAGVTSIMGTVGDALAESGDAGDLRDATRACVERCLKMSAFITRFADVVKIPEPTLQCTTLNEVVNDNVRFLESLCSSKGVLLHLRLTDGDTAVEVDEALFGQVLVNIVKNAVESIGEGPGDVFITTSAVPLRLEVADTGKGLSPEAEQKLFSPFFTTKPNGQGIGLLFIREVLTAHHCRFSLKTRPDGLTCFTIQF
jgi:nitrogen fixation/metabolism regulation signal transduction histidine kinase